MKPNELVINGAGVMVAALFEAKYGQVLRDAFSTAFRSELDGLFIQRALHGAFQSPAVEGLSEDAYRQYIQELLAVAIPLLVAHEGGDFAKGFCERALVTSLGEAPPVRVALTSQSALGGGGYGL